MRFISVYRHSAFTLRCVVMAYPYWRKHIRMLQLRYFHAGYALHVDLRDYARIMPSCLSW